MTPLNPLTLSSSNLATAGSFSAAFPVKKLLTAPVVSLSF